MCPQLDQKAELRPTSTATGPGWHTLVEDRHPAILEFGPQPDERAGNMRLQFLFSDKITPG